MRKIKINLNPKILQRKYMLFADWQKVCIYRKYWIILVKKYTFPAKELNKAMEYLNHLNHKNK